MRVRDEDLRYALGSAPTSHWRGVFDGSWELIKNGTVCVYAGVRVVDDTAWRNAMQKLWRLPSGGRHVAEARRELSWAINRALNFERESK
jgi:hypothetical protein